MLLRSKRKLIKLNRSNRKEHIRKGRTKKQSKIKTKKKIKKKKRLKENKDKTPKPPQNSMKKEEKK